MKICDMFKLQKRKVTVLGLLLEKTHAQCYSVFATISNKTCCLVKWTELYDIHILHTLEWKCARYSSICRRHFVPAKFRTIPNSTDCKLIELNMTLWNFRQVYSPKLDLKIKNHSALERFISTHGVLWATVSCDLHLDTVLRQKKKSKFYQWTSLNVKVDLPLLYVLRSFGITESYWHMPLAPFSRLENCKIEQAFQTMRNV